MADVVCEESPELVLVSRPHCIALKSAGEALRTQSTSECDLALLLVLRVEVRRKASIAA